MQPETERRRFIVPHSDEPLLVRWAWVPVNFVHGLFVASWTAGWITIALIVARITGGPRVPLRMARTIWAKGLFVAGRYPVSVDNRGGIDFERGWFFACNHRSFLDIPTLFLALPTGLRFVVKAELARVPFLAAYIRAMGMVFVERKRRTRRRQNEMQQIRDILGHGSSIVAFPEGTRSRDGHVLPFHSGVLAQAIEAGVPVVPVAILGTADALPPSGWKPRPRRAMTVVLGTPIPTEGLQPGDRRKLTERVRQAVVELVATTPDPNPKRARRETAIEGVAEEHRGASPG